MTWQFVVCFSVYVFFLAYITEKVGMFERIRRVLNPPPQMPAQIQPTAYDDSAIKADIDKLKLALSVKEFKR